MYKKGVIWESISHVFLAGLIIVIGFSAIYIDTRIVKEKRSEFFNERILRINDDDIFYGFLLKEKDNIAVIDLLQSHNIDQQKEEITLRMNEMLVSTFGSEMCWIMSIDEEEWIKENKCQDNKQIPLINTFVVSPGYEESFKISMLVQSKAK